MCEAITHQEHQNIQRVWNVLPNTRKTEQAVLVTGVDSTQESIQTAHKMYSLRRRWSAEAFDDAVAEEAGVGFDGGLVEG